jgi:hypothetical protein
MVRHDCGRDPILNAVAFAAALSSVGSDAFRPSSLAAAAATMLTSVFATLARTASGFEIPHPRPETLRGSTLVVTRSRSADAALTSTLMTPPFREASLRIARVTGASMT